MGKNIYSLKEGSNRAAFLHGLRDGIPIGLGYLAVSFSLGIAAKSAGLTYIEGFFCSILCLASAGQYAGFTIMAAGGSLAEMAVMTLVINARYLLMSTALSQRLDQDLPFAHRFFLAYPITDELFGIAISQPGYLNPNYSYGAVLVAAPLWALGTALGIIAGNILPLRAVSALSVALYGMFLAVFIPPARKSRVILGIVALSFAASWVCSVLPGISGLSEGTRTIILTLIIASLAALLFPHEEDGETAPESSEIEKIGKEAGHASR
ncbi:MAG: AzlC family ABC transporter permease [Eubacterium sp.]|nr:AzlC family ABC transporter permease [Eubacterium sp.]